MADAGALIGTWRMLSWTRTVVATGAVTDAMGPNPNGYIAYQTDGRMMALVVDGRTRQPGAQAASDADKAALFDSPMLAYSATYRIEGDHVIHTVDAAWHPAWCGDLIRPFKLDGDSL